MFPAWGVRCRQVPPVALRGVNTYANTYMRLACRALAGREAPDPDPDRGRRCGSTRPATRSLCQYICQYMNFPVWTGQVCPIRDGGGDAPTRSRTGHATRPDEARGPTYFAGDPLAGRRRASPRAAESLRRRTRSTSGPAAAGQPLRSITLAGSHGKPPGPISRKEWKSGRHPSRAGFSARSRIWRSDCRIGQSSHRARCERRAVRAIRNL